MALKGNQKKIDKNNNNRIDAEDFKILKAEKAKGRGMGLQDEKVKPGKVMKARVGKSVKGTTAKSAMGKTFSGYQKVFKTGVSAGEKAKGTSTIVGVKPTLPEAAKSSKVARRALKAAQATRLGKILLPVAAAGVAAQQYLKGKMKKKDEPKKKMGGGMMKRPMGYTKGGGADTGKVGEMKSKISVLSNKLRRQGMRLTKRDIEKAGDIAGSIGPYTKKKMGGGMMMKPMGYKEGSPRPSQQARSKSRRKMPGVAGVGLGALGASTSPEFIITTSVPEGPAKRFKTTKQFKLSNKMGGGMMNKPMGYKAGKSVKAKCKLGKNKPTKMY